MDENKKQRVIDAANRAFAKLLVDLFDEFDELPNEELEKAIEKLSKGQIELDKAVETTDKVLERIIAAMLKAIQKEIAKR